MATTKSAASPCCSLSKLPQLSSLNERRASSIGCPSRRILSSSIVGTQLPITGRVESGRGAARLNVGPRAEGEFGCRADVQRCRSGH